MHSRINSQRREIQSPLKSDVKLAGQLRKAFWNLIWAKENMEIEPVQLDQMHLGQLQLEAAQLDETWWKLKMQQNLRVGGARV